MLGLFRKRSKLPAERRPAFDRDERVLAWAPTSADDTVIATNLGLWWGGVRTGWHEIDKVTWDGSVLVVIPAVITHERDGYTVIADGTPVRFVLADPDHLPNQVRLRVTNSVSYPVHYELPGDEQGAGCGTLWLAGRRVPGIDGLTWVVRYDQGTDGEDPAVVAATDELVAATRADVAAAQDVD